jgi:hypothetical protein
MSTPPGDADALLRQLHTAVARLAAPVDQQIEWIRRTGVHPDELALELDGVLDASVTSNPELGRAAGQALRLLEEELAAMSGSANAVVWTEEGLRKDPRWARVRELACAALSSWGWSNR